MPEPYFYQPQPYQQPQPQPYQQAYSHQQQHVPQEQKVRVAECGHCGGTIYLGDKVQLSNHGVVCVDASGQLVVDQARGKGFALIHEGCTAEYAHDNITEESCLDALIMGDISIACNNCGCEMYYEPLCSDCSDEEARLRGQIENE